MHRNAHQFRVNTLSLLNSGDTVAAQERVTSAHSHSAHGHADPVVGQRSENVIGFVRSDDRVDSASDIDDQAGVLAGTFRIEIAPMDEVPGHLFRM